MPYLPPHLRDREGGGSGSDSDGGRGGSGRGGDRYDDRRGGGGRDRYDDRRGDRYDDRRRDDRYDDRRRDDRYDDRRRDDRYDDRRGGDRGVPGSEPSSGGGSKYPPPVFVDYKPSARVQALTINQVREPSRVRTPRETRAPTRASRARAGTARPPRLEKPERVTSSEDPATRLRSVFFLAS